MIESVLSWLTPTVLFCVLNLMIATIFITSTIRNTNNEKKQQEAGEDQLPRTPSLLQRVRSVNLSFPDPFNSPLTTHHHFPQNSPSLLQRVRSINLSFSSQKPSPFPSLDQDEQPPAAAAEEVDLNCHVTRTKSATCAEEEAVVHREKKVGNRRGGTKLFRDEEEDAVDKKADDFINKFREELKMQRLNSILNKGVSI